MEASRSLQPRARIQSLARADAILNVIAASSTAKLSEISKATSLNKSTAFYLVETLVELGFVERVGAGNGYRLGLRNLELGRAVQRRLDVAAMSRPSLIRLCALSKETVNLAVPFIFDAMIVESLEGAYGVRATSYAGSRAPYHSTACGKAILAFQAPAVREAIYRARPLIPITPNTLSRVELLEAQLTEIQQRGYAVDIEENELGAHCIAAPIRDDSGEVIAAISISGLANRLPMPELAKLAGVIIEETKAIGQLMSKSFSHGLQGLKGDIS